MKIRTFQSLILMSALVMASIAPNAIANTQNANINDYLLQVSTDSASNYHLSFYADVSKTHDLDQENQDYNLYRSYLTNTKEGVITSNEERIEGLIQAIQYFTTESPRAFSLEPRAERLVSEELGETQRYTFCVHFGPVMNSTSCINTSFIVNETDLITELNAAGVKYETPDGKSEVYGQSEGYDGDTGGTDGGFYDHLVGTFDKPLSPIGPPSEPPREAIEP